MFFLVIRTGMITSRFLQHRSLLFFVNAYSFFLFVIIGIMRFDTFYETENIDSLQTNNINY